MKPSPEADRREGPPLIVKFRSVQSVHGSLSLCIKIFGVKIETRMYILEVEVYFIEFELSNSKDESVLIHHLTGRHDILNKVTTCRASPFFFRCQLKLLTHEEYVKSWVQTLDRDLQS